MSFTYPVFLSLKNKRAVVIGGGKIAARKVTALLKAEAEVVVVAKEASKGLLRLAEKREIRCYQRPFRPSDIKGAWLVIAATNDHALNERVARETQKCRQWINVVDKPALCQLIFPSVVRKGKLTMAISTNGASPALAKAIRKDLQKNFIPKYERSLKEISRVRSKVLKTTSSVEKRRGILNQLAEKLLHG